MFNTSITIDQLFDTPEFNKFLLDTTKIEYQEVIDERIQKTQKMINKTTSSMRVVLKSKVDPSQFKVDPSLSMPDSSQPLTSFDTTNDSSDNSLEFFTILEEQKEDLESKKVILTQPLITVARLL